METPPALTGSPQMTRWGRYFLSVYTAASIFFIAGCMGIFLLGWWPDSPATFPGFGATPLQCKRVYGDPVPGSFAKTPSPKSLWYVAGGWWVLVGFDEQDRAEQFIFCKEEFPFIRGVTIADSQQRRLLKKLKQGSTWSVSIAHADGKQWVRKDDQATALYVQSLHWMIFMNQAGWDRFEANVKAKGY